LPIPTRCSQSIGFFIGIPPALFDGETQRIGGIE
jgi:hypothetical protein